MRGPLAAVALAALLAGCADLPERQGLTPPAETPGRPPQHATTVLAVDTRRAEGSPFAGSTGGPFDVPAGSVALVAESRWACEATGEPCVMNLVLRDPSGRVVAGDTRPVGDQAARVELPAPAQGTWHAALTGPAGEVIGDIRVAVFQTVPPPGWSAYVTNVPEGYDPGDVIPGEPGPQGRPAGPGA